MPHASPIAIRQLVAADVDLMRQLLRVFGDVFDEPKTYQARQPSDAYLKGLLDGDSFIALAALADGEVVGGLAAYHLRKFEQERSEIHVYDLAVAEAYRRRGIATGLFERLKAIAAERGVYLIFVQADYGDDPAIALYTKLGAREEVLHFDIEVT
jgi:aminoglycoside 3-N-acetyltransferase I